MLCAGDGDAGLRCNVARPKWAFQRRRYLSPALRMGTISWTGRSLAGGEFLYPRGCRVEEPHLLWDRLTDALEQERGGQRRARGWEAPRVPVGSVRVPWRTTHPMCVQEGKSGCSVCDRLWGGDWRQRDHVGSCPHFPGEQ